MHEVLNVADKLHHGRASPTELAEFIRLVSQESDLNILKRLLSANYDYTGVILERIKDLLPTDLKIYLALALWKYNNGLDEDASQLLQKARQLSQEDQAVLQMDLWLSFPEGRHVLLNKSNALLQAFPNDKWAKAISERLSHEAELTRLDSPDWDNEWIDLINSAWKSPI